MLSDRLFNARSPLVKVPNDCWAFGTKQQLFYKLPPLSGCFLLADNGILRAR
ncbi:hypothetical protein SAMN05192562_101481 [Kosakonia arachidis]|uniref:Uncharacterized protein n=1 Tax=Kosakonia arachidis TaxID=551989 RepID=A0A1I6YE96_9ENTR|nr:hypothetical protein SAMN05192562_101481 [Kosakonia arachidis]